MGLELMPAMTMVQGAAMAAPAPGRVNSKHKRALALVGKSNCRSLYRLRGMNFSKFTTQQNIAIATGLLTRSSRWVASIKNKVPTTGNYLELRFFVDTFMKIANDSGALSLYKSMSTPINLPKNATARKIKKGIASITSDMRRVKRFVPAPYTSSVAKLIGVLDTLARHRYLNVGWSWIVASDNVIKKNLSQCK